MKTHNMSDYITRVVPFSVERAEKIMAGEMAGVIRTRDGYDARILCTDLDDHKPIVAAVRDIDSNEELEQYYTDGHYYRDSKCADHDLVIEVPTEYKDYSNFRPTKYQPCLVRDKNGWRVAVCMGYESDGKYGLHPIWMSGDARIVTSGFEAVPLSIKTEGLLGKEISYTEYVKTMTDETTD